jgi:tetratricopeptide (TPR) repeat protein
MYIDRRYRGRRRRSPWPIIALLAIILVPGIYLLATRTHFFENPFNPLQPTPTPTRSAVSYLAEAEDNYKAGLLTTAAEGYQRVTELEPQNDEAFNRLAWLWILRGRPERAVEIARKAVELNPSAPNLTMLAMALDWDNQYDEAIEIALRAVDKDPLSADAHAVLGEVYADRNNWTRALDEGEQAVQLDPNSATVQRSLGYVLSMQGRYREALDTYAKAAELAPKLGYIYISAGKLHMILNEYEDAIAQFEQAVQANPDTPTGYDALGHASALNGDPDRAISTLRKAIELDSEYALAYAHLGRVYYTLLNWESAVENFIQAFALGLKNEEYFYEAGLAYAYLEDCNNAKIWLEQALELNPDSRPAQDGLRRCEGQ